MRATVKMLFLTVLVCFSTNPVFSQNEEDLSEFLSGLEEDQGFHQESEWQKAETFVITASKMEENINKAAASITVITDQDLWNMGARNLSDALRTVPGIGLSQNSVGYWEIESRGIKTFFSEKVLFMLNSRPIDINFVNGGSAATPRLDNLPIDSIKRIEIIRGPGSALYGANAFTALINIISKDAKDIDGVSVSAGRGSFDTQQYNVLFGKRLSGIDMAANFNFYDTGGFQAFVEHDLQTNLDRIMGTNSSMAPGHSDSWEKKYDAELKLGYGGLKFSGRYVRREAGACFGIVNALNDDSHLKYDFHTLGLEYAKEINGQLDLTARLYRDHMAFDNYFEIFPEGYGGVFPEGYNLKTPAKCSKTGLEMQAAYRLHRLNHIIMGAMGEQQQQRGVEYFANHHPLTGDPVGDPAGLHDWSDTLNWNGDHDRDLWAVYLEDIWDIRDDLRLTIGGRYDHFSDFGGVFNPRAGFAWEFAESYRLKMMYGQAFRAPTFAEQYNINNPAYIGNPDVQPEKVKTIEIGFGGDFTDRLSAGITYFHSDISDLIGFSEPDDSGIKTYENRHSVTSQGIELEMRARLRRGSYIAANYTYQHAKDGDTGRQLPDVPEHKGNIMANVRLSKSFNWYAHLFLKGKTPRAKGDPRDGVSGYCLIDTALTAKKFLKQWDGLELRASVHNLLDKDHVDPAPTATLPGDYPQPGRSVMFEVRYEY